MYLDENGECNDAVRRLERFAVSAVQLSVESKNLQLDRQKLIRLEEEKTRSIINIFNVQRLNVVQHQQH